MAVFNTSGTDAGAAVQNQGQTISTFLGGLGTGLALFGAEIFVFFLLHNSLSRIYRPKTYLVPEKERTKPPPSTWFTWIVPVFMTSNAELIQRCGLDAYFFLRYLRMLLKIFFPAACIILPVLIPINVTNPTRAHGLDKLGWNNYDPKDTSRFWAHLVLAIVLLLWIFYVVRDELRGYIRVRQSYLTSPQHRLRASATTVLVTSIPRKWLTYEALNGLYDVMPGGIRNIWINRDFDELNEKIKLRDQWAKKLENAETALIRNAVKKHTELEAKKKKKGIKGAEEGEQSDSAADLPIAEEFTNGEKPAARLENALAEARNVEEVSPEDDHRGRTPAPALTLRDERPSTQHDVPTFELTTPTSTIGAGEAQGDGRPSQEPASRLVHHHHWAQARAADSSNKRGWKIWKGDSHGIRALSPEPHKREAGDEGHSHDASATVQAGKTDERGAVENHEVANSKLLSLFSVKSKAAQGDSTKYPDATDEAYADDEGFDAKPVWKRYLDYGDRDTMRLPVKSWMPALPNWMFIGKKVDVIYYCRREVARLNVEIELDQQEPEKYPLMNSAFIQFNHQIAAHMACQCVSHHAPHHMSPRIVEISPNDVLWDNLSIKWWERYLRITLVLTLVSGLVVAWAIPTSFLAAVTNLRYIATTWPHAFGWINSLPSWFISVLQGVFPVLALLLLTLLLPVILRFAAKQQGVVTGMMRELNVQTYYFAFSFVQLFLVVTVSTSLFKVIDGIINTPYNTPQILGANIPKSANFFFNYMLIQGLSGSAGTLAQLGALFGWYILRKMLDNTARQKFARQLKLPTISWGTFFPIYTTLGCIAIIYSVISPLILPFAIITFSLFWVVFRYQTLYVTRTQNDTGGLMFPKAVNQLFVGVYFLELALIGLFFLVRDEQDNVACAPQAIIMIVAAALTIIYQIMFNVNYYSLFRYMPITLEDDAVLADEEYARIQAKRWESNQSDGPRSTPPSEEEDIEDRLAREAREEDNEERAAEAIEMDEINNRRRSRATSRLAPITSVGSRLKPNLGALGAAARGRRAWATEDRHTSNNVERSPGRTNAINNAITLDFAKRRLERLEKLRLPAQVDGLQGATGLDIESQGAQQTAVGDALFGAFNDEIEDLTPEERDALVQRAFLHKALRARRPCIWIPRDKLGVSRDEIMRTRAYALRGESVDISDEWTGLDAKGRVVIRRAPPDFSDLDLIEL